MNEQLITILIILHLVGVLFAFRYITYIKDSNESDLKATIVWWAMCLMGFVGLLVVWFMVGSREEERK